MKPEKETDVQDKIEQETDVEKVETSEKIIKTDKIIYKLNTREKCDWLMKKLEEGGCRWKYTHALLQTVQLWSKYEPHMGICLKDKTITHDLGCFYNNNPDHKDYRRLVKVLGFSRAMAIKSLKQQFVYTVKKQAMQTIITFLLMIK